MPKILLIDDDESVRTLIRRMLTQFGHTVIEACDGREGLQLFQSADFDLVITDLVMPEMEGLEVLKEVRRKLPPVKILVISGGGRHGRLEYIEAARLLGASKVLAKPFSTDDLMNAVDELLLSRPTLNPTDL